MKKLFGLLALCGFASIVATVVGCHDMLNPGAEVEIFRDTSSLIGGTSASGDSGIGGGWLR